MTLVVTLCGVELLTYCRNLLYEQHIQALKGMRTALMRIAVARRAVGPHRALSTKPVQLTPDERTTAVAELNGWEVSAAGRDEIRKTFEFADFRWLHFGRGFLLTCAFV